MPEFSFRYVKRKTGRPNRGTARAFDEAELRAMLAEREEVSEVLEIVALPEPEATDRQLAYLADLNVDIGGTLTLREASDLIDNAQKRRQPADQAARQLAARYRVETTQYTSKAAIFRRILGEVSGDPVELSRFFVYRVYRDALGSDRAGAIDDPRAAIFEEAAAALRADASALKSLRRATADSRTAFRWFGDLIGEGGVLLGGDSEATTAYRVAKSELSKRGLYSARRREAGDRRAKLPRQARHAAREAGLSVAPARSAPHSQDAVSMASARQGLGWVWWLVALALIGILLW